MNILLTLPILLVAISCIFASSQETNNVASKSDPSDDGKNDLLIRQAYTLAKELLDSSSSNEEEQEDDHHENNTENKVNEDNKNRDEEDEIVEELLDWIITNGGYIHPNAHVKFVPPTQSYRGVFVKNVNEEGGTPEGIKKGDIMCKIPW